MVNSTVSTVDLGNRQDVKQVLPQQPLVDSYWTNWRRLTFTHYRHDSHETVEHYLLQHSVVITDPKSDFRAERHLNGESKIYAHGKGRIDIIPAFLSHRTSWDRQIEFSVIAISPTLLDQAAQELTQRNIELIPKVAVKDSVIQQLAIALKVEIQTGCTSGRLYGESLGMALAARLVQNYISSKPALKSKAYGLSKLQLSRVTDYIKTNLAQDISISDLATLLNMSTSHFSRAFKQSMRTTPYQYLIQQRVGRAKQLLNKQSIPISEIALDCGFANQTHLTKVFRQMIGVTPKTYQRQSSEV